jgi:hypothetical protein
MVARRRDEEMRRVDDSGAGVGPGATTPVGADDLARLRGARFVLATPMYGGTCTGAYAQGVAELAEVAATAGIHVERSFVFGESLVTRARNHLVSLFLASDLTHLLFVDADIGFGAADALRVMADNVARGPLDVSGATYARKRIAWDQVARAARAGVAELDLAAGSIVVEPLPGTTEIRIDAPAEVSRLGTGFMVVPRTAFEAVAAAHPELAYRPDPVPDAPWSPPERAVAFFDTGIDPATRRYVSEDYAFCDLLRGVGGRVWLVPDVDLDHHGTHRFRGSIGALARLPQA